MKIKNLNWLVLLGALTLALSACGSGNATLTPPPTRNATQTPWIIYVPVTTTPEPATITPFPTVGGSGGNPVAKPTATRTVPRATAAPKPAATATKPAAPVAAVSPTPAVTCNLGTVTLVFPDNNAPRVTKRSGPASDTFEFKWTPYQPGEGDAQVGYKIDLESRAGGKIINSDNVFISHNWFIQNGLKYIYDTQRIHNLAAPSANDEVMVTWKITVVKTSGSFDNQGKISGNVTNCGAPSEIRTIKVEVRD